MRNEMTDESIIDGIRKKDNSVFEYIYSTYYSQVKWFIKKMDDKELADIDDLFQESIIDLLFIINDESFVLKSTFKTFLFSVCKKKHLKRLRIAKQNNIEFITEKNIDDVENAVLNEIQLAEESTTEIKNALIRKYFIRLEKNCKDILKMFSKRIPFKNIAEIMGYSTEQKAWERKQLCKKYLLKLIEKDELYQQIINNEENE